MHPFDSPRLLADIGGTYARFVVETAPGRFEHPACLRCAEHADFHAAVSAYLAPLPVAPIAHAAVAIANPVDGDEVRMTNYHWQFSIEQMRARLQLDTLVVVNDFTALAMAVPRLAAHDRRQVGGGQAREGSVIGLIGAGSGLGVSGLIPAGGGWVALGTEGGHASFAPHDEREIAILRFAWQRFDHVSFERLLSGPGLELIHSALAEHAGEKGAPALPAPEITRRGLAGSDPLCAAAIEAFCAMLGTAASNLAVTLGALGGIYVGGGIVPRLGAYLARSPFRARFEDKGRFSDYLRSIPTHVITAENATLTGASAILQAQLRTREDAPRSALLERIRRGLEALSPAEQRVARHVLAHPRAALNDPVAEIARAAAVSQPTVIRFCRSLGCAGLSDFKLQLASGLTGTIPVTHAQVTGTDTTAELGAKVLDNTASAILQVREHFNRESIDRAIDLLAHAGRVDFHALGHGGPVAQDAQFKFMRLGIASQACTDAGLQLLAAGLLRPGDVAVIISSSAHGDELIEVAALARSRGAAVIAITASQSRLARKADLALIVDHAEDADTQLPMVSRILQLLMIDILAVGISLRRDGATASARGTHALTDAPPPGAGALLPHARLTSHGRR
jgi:glucokinase